MKPDVARTLRVIAWLLFFILFLLLRHFEPEEWAKLQHDFGWIDAPFVWIGWGWDWCWHWIVQWVPLGEPWLSIAQWSVGLFAAFLVFGVLNEFALCGVAPIKPDTGLVANGIE